MSYKHRSLDEYHIPPSLVELMAALVKAQPGDRVLDLCWRNDDLLDAIACQQPSGVDLWGVSSQGDAVHSRHRICVSELLADVPGLMPESFDVVVVSPPWIAKPRLPKSIRERCQVAYRRFDSVALCLEWSTRYLRTDGRIVAIVPGGFLSSYSSKPVRKFLRDRLRLQAVFEITPRAPVFRETAISTAIICFDGASLEDRRPESFMAEINDLDNLGLVLELYEVALRASNDLVPFHIAFVRVGRSYVFTCEPKDTFSPARNYFAQHAAGKLAHFPTERLGDIATVRLGLLLRDRSSILSQNETPYKLLTARNVARDGQIAGSPLFLQNAVADTLSDTCRLCTDDLLISAIQQAPRRTGCPFQAGSYDEGLVVSIVPPEHEGAFYDRSLICIRLADDAPARITPQYVAQLLRNEFVLQDFNEVVLDQVLAAVSSAGDSFARVAPPLIGDLNIPVLPAPVVADYQGRLERYFGPYWQSLFHETRLFLATGEFWYDFSRDMDLVVDFGGIAIELCKAVEVELWRRLGQHLGTRLISQGIETYPFWCRDDHYKKAPISVKDLGKRRVSLGAFEGFLWGITKRSHESASEEQRHLADRIYSVISSASPHPDYLVSPHGIPKLLSELIQYRNASPHKDRLERPELEKLHSIVVPATSEDSLLVRIVRAIPLPDEQGIAELVSTLQNPSHRRPD